MKSNDATIQMKPTEHYFPVVIVYYAEQDSSNF